MNVYENAELPVSYAQIDYVLLTHAHNDHAGSSAVYLCQRIPRQSGDYDGYGRSLPDHAEG